MQHRQAKDAGSRTDPVTPASVPETLDFVEREKLYGLSCGKVGMTLLASPLITPGATLWTLDKRLDAPGERFEVAHQTPFH